MGNLLPEQHYFVNIAGLYSEPIQNVPRFGGRQQNRESCTSSMGLDLIPDTQNCHSLAGYDISQTIATQIEEASVSFIMFYPFKWHIHKWDILRPIESPLHHFTLQRSSRIPLPCCSKSIHVQWEMPVIFNHHPTLVALDKTKIYDAYIILRFNAFPEVSLVSQSLTIWLSLSRWRRTKLLAAKATKRRQQPWGHMERAVSICLVFPDISSNDHWVTRNMFISHMRTMLLGDFLRANVGFSIPAPWFAYGYITSGKLTVCCWTSPFWVDKSTISMAIFNSYW